MRCLAGLGRMACMTVAGMQVSRRLLRLATVLLGAPAIGAADGSLPQHQCQPLSLMWRHRMNSRRGVASSTQSHHQPGAASLAQHGPAWRGDPVREVGDPLPLARGRGESQVHPQVRGSSDHHASRGPAQPIQHHQHLHLHQHAHQHMHLSAAAPITSLGQPNRAGLQAEREMWSAGHAEWARPQAGGLFEGHQPAARSRLDVEARVPRPAVTAAGGERETGGSTRHRNDLHEAARRAGPGDGASDEAAFDSAILAKSANSPIVAMLASTRRRLARGVDVHTPARRLSSAADPGVDLVVTPTDTPRLVDVNPIGTRRAPHAKLPSAVLDRPERLQLQWATVAPSAVDPVLASDAAAGPHASTTSGATPHSPASGPLAGGIQQDAELTRRLTDEVIRQVERRLRIERERRGL